MLYQNHRLRNRVPASFPLNIFNLHLIYYFTFLNFFFLFFLFKYIQINSNYYLYFIFNFEKYLKPMVKKIEKCRKLAIEIYEPRRQ